MLIIYHRGCLDCGYSKQVKQLRKLCEQNGTELVIRRVILSPKWKQEAEERSDLGLPYIWNSKNNKSVGLRTGDLLGLL